MNPAGWFCLTAIVLLLLWLAGLLIDNRSTHHRVIETDLYELVKKQEEERKKDKVTTYLTHNVWTTNQERN